MKTPTQTEIAAALGVTKQRISRLAQRGMPTDTIEAARQWRHENLRFYMHPQAPVEAAHALDRANALALSALDWLKSGRFTEVEDELRLALRAVPDEDAERLRLPFAVFDALTVDVRKALDEMATEPGDRIDSADFSDEDAEWMGRFWMQVARGLVRVAGSDSAAGDLQAAALLS